MAKNKRNRSQKPSAKNPESASRSASTDSAARNSSPPPSSTTDVEASSSPKEEFDADKMNLDMGRSSQGAEVSHEQTGSQDQDTSRAGEARVLTYDGASDDPTPIENFQSPTATDQSLLGQPQDSPVARRRSYNNLADELDGADLDRSDWETSPENSQKSITSPLSQFNMSPQEDPGVQHPEIGGPDQPRDTDPRQQHPQNKETVEAQSSDEVTPGRTVEGFEEEMRKRLAAEERVRVLEAEAAAEQQRYEDEMKTERAGFERAIRRVERDRDAEKEKYEMKSEDKDKKIQEFQAKLQESLDNVQSLEAALEEGQKAHDSRGTGEGVPSGSNEAENEQEKFRGSLQRELDVSMGGPSSPRDGHRPGSARFLLAEYEYLLDKNSPLYEAILATSNYADGRGGWPSDEHRRLFDAFKDTSTAMNEFLAEHEDQPQDCLLESKRDWAVAVEENGCVRGVRSPNETLGTSILGHDFSAPFYITACGRAQLTHSDAELGLLRGAARAGILYIGAASTNWEAVDTNRAEGQVMFQQWYMRNKPTVVQAVFDRAKAAGLSAIALKVDSPTVEDVREAVAHDVPDIILSNHGGRGVDTPPSPLEIAKEAQSSSIR
ncbi:hypothetical protein diail_3431 [Diaporthe ilicicola]|nr:hypothetical protein diail_3431 [Diaporthe ilicicola]